MTGTELLGILASIASVVTGFGWVLDRNAKRYQEIHLENTTAMEKVGAKMEKMESVLTDVRLEMPQRYVSKEELLLHIEGEAKWHSSVDRRLEDIRGEISALRQWSHRP